MDTWQGAFLGLRELPPEISAFELQAFFTFSGAERAAIEERRHPAHKLGLALHIGFLRMSGRPLDAVRIVPANLWQHLSAELGIDAPDLAARTVSPRSHALRPPTARLRAARLSAYE